MRGRVISVIIPVYKESPYLEKLIKCLSAQHADKEIIVIIDEPTKASLELVNKFKEIKFILNRKRMGKVAALNKAAKITRGEILLFLDADVEINDNEFLKKLELEMRDAEFIDIKKVVVKDSFLSRMTYYEYLGFNIGSYLLSRFLRKCPAVNGSAFAVKRYVFEKIGGFRKVIVEDVDIATRAFVNGYAFKYLPNIHVYNHVPKTWWAWIEQRKRWSIGTALWFREWYKEMIGIAIKKPEIVLPALLFVFPAVVIVIVNIFIPNLWVYKLLSLVFIFFAIKFNIMFPLLMLTTVGINIVKNLFILLASFLFFAFLFFYFSRRLGFHFNLQEFLLYYMFYSILSLFILIVGFMSVFILRKSKIEGWKV